jgi:hypothetical protein
MGESCGEQIEVYPPQGALDTTALILDRSKQSAAQRIESNQCGRYCERLRRHTERRIQTLVLEVESDEGPSFDARPF